MMPGLHPGLLLASRPRITFWNVPEYLYIPTSGSAGTRPLNLSVTIENGVGPFAFSWEITLSGFAANPASGAGNTAGPIVGFNSGVYYDGFETGFQLVGEAYLMVTSSNGLEASLRVDVYAGQ